MPIYEFHCKKCSVDEEVILPLLERNNPRMHTCGFLMERLISLPQPPIMRVMNRDRIMNTLNRDDGFGFPDDKHTTRYGKVIMDNLNQSRLVIGKGF